MWRVGVRMKGAGLTEGHREDTGAWVLIQFSSFPRGLICSLVQSVCACPVIVSHRGV